jgi:hypothetical protein
MHYNVGDNVGTHRQSFSYNARREIGQPMAGESEERVDYNVGTHRQSLSYNARREIGRPIAGESGKWPDYNVGNSLAVTQL